MVERHKKARNENFGKLKKVLKQAFLPRAVWLPEESRGREKFQNSVLTNREWFVNIQVRGSQGRREENLEN